MLQVRDHRSSTSSRASSTRLVQGVTHPAVATLQRLLSANGLYGKALDGRFGPLTDAAVRHFQKRHGLKVDGWAGPKTMAALKKAAAALAGRAQQVLRAAGLTSRPTGTTRSAPRTGDGFGGTAPVASSSGPRASAGVQAALAYGKSVLGSPYAAVNPFRFGSVPWDGGRHQSVNGSGTWYQYPKGTRVFDCSGFVVACFKRAGVDLLAKGLATSGAIKANANGFLRNVSKDQLQPGDLITYASASNGVGHVVIYLGNGQCLEAAGGRGVSISAVKWDRANSFRRVPVP